MKRIPVCIPEVPANASKYVNEVMDKNWISSACFDDDVNFIKKLEEGFCKFTGAQYAVSVTNGTAAVSLALAALKIGPGDEIIIPDFTMIASVAPVIQRGAKPVFVDSDSHSWCIDPKLIEAKITENTKAIMPVHIYGYPSEMDEIMSIADKHKLLVIEDAAEAIGTSFNGQHAGSIGSAGCFSFYANKLVTSGEGGIMVTNSKEVYDRAEMLKDQAFGEPRFIHQELGYNYRMNNLTAAYAYASLEEAEAALSKKTSMADIYCRNLESIDGITLPPRSTDRIVSSYWMFGVMIDDKFGISKNDVRKRLKEEHGVDTRDFFCPMHKQPVILNKELIDSNDAYPVAEKLWNQGFYLPSGTGLTEEDIIYIVDALKTIRGTT